MRAVLFPLTLAALLVGCGDLTGGGFGEVEVYATAVDPGPSGLAAAAAQPGAHLAAAEGLLAAELRVYLRSDESAAWTEITDGVRDLTLDLRGDTERRVGVKFVAGGRYSGFRVVFSRVQATVTGGLTVGGAPLTGEIGVDPGPQGSFTVERQVLVEVDEDRSLDLVIDLNAEVWLAAASPITHSVPATAFLEAVGVRAR